MPRFPALLAALVCAPLAVAQPVALVAPPVPLPVITAKSFLLTDLTTHQTLVAQNAEERREPASLTKLMTAYVPFAALHQKQITMTPMAKVSERAWYGEAS